MVRGRRGRTANKLIESKQVCINTSPNVATTVKITNFFQPDNRGGIENSQEDERESRSCIRMSPRKHASTLSVLQLQNNNNTPRKSPHKIEINYDAVIENLTGVTSENHTQTPQPPKKRRVQKKNLKNKESVVPNGSAKVTDFFPIRRSVRQTKKVVLEEKKRELELSIINQREDGLTVKNFGDKGRGVITTKQFIKGDFVVEYAGELISVEEAKEREELYANDVGTGCYMYYFLYRNTQMCIDATAESNRLGRLVNHCRQGNLITKIIEVNSKPHLVLIAKEDIPEGIEITYDYGDRSKESLKYHPWLAF